MAKLRPGRGAGIGHTGGQTWQGAGLGRGMLLEATSGWRSRGGRPRGRAAPRTVSPRGLGLHLLSFVFVVLSICVPK